MKLFSADWDDGFFWFRLFGKGILVRDATKSMVLFTEKYGITKWWYIGKWKFKFLEKAR